MKKKPQSSVKKFTENDLWSEKTEKLDQNENEQGSRRHVFRGRCYAL